MTEPTDPPPGPPPADVVRLPIRFREPPNAERTLLGPYEPPFYPTCTHRMVQYLVDPSEAEVTCGRCKTKLNPMWVLSQLANDDRRHEENRRAANEAQKRLDERSRVKCESCGKMTRIRRI